MELGGGGLSARHVAPSAAREAVDDLVFGHVERMVEAHAVDPEVRFVGSWAGC